MIPAWGAVLIAFGTALGGFFFKSWTLAWDSGISQGSIQTDLKNIKQDIQELTEAIGRNNIQQAQQQKELATDFYRFRYRVALKLGMEFESER